MRTVSTFVNRYLKVLLLPFLFPNSSVFSTFNFLIIPWTYRLSMKIYAFEKLKMFTKHLHLFLI